MQAKASRTALFTPSFLLFFSSFLYIIYFRAVVAGYGCVRVTSYGGLTAMGGQSYFLSTRGSNNYSSSTVEPIRARTPFLYIL